MNRDTDNRNGGEMKLLRGVEDRLKRVETKLLRGFEEMGVSTEMDPNWLTVDDASRTIYVSTLGRSLSVILKYARQKGATQVGKAYDIVHKGETMATVILRD